MLVTFLLYNNLLNKALIDGFRELHVPWTMTSLLAQMVKCLPTMQETWGQSLGWEDLLEKEMATHSSILAWKIPWTEEPGRLQSMGSQRVRHDWANSLSLSLCYSLDVQTRVICFTSLSLSFLICITGIYILLSSSLIAQVGVASRIRFWFPSESGQYFYNCFTGSSQSPLCSLGQKAHPDFPYSPTIF